MDASREQRIHASLLASVEKRLLIWMAGRLPARIGSDHLTALASVALLLAGCCYWIAPSRPWAPWAVVALVIINWFGDSLDGTVARVRHHERPRYGFYVDHVLDAIGILCLIGGLMLGGFMSMPVGAGFLIAYYLLTIEIALATHALGTFRISYWKFGPTELRILLIAGTLQLLRSPEVTFFGAHILLFDLGGAIAIAGLAATFAVSATTNTRTLYRAEPLPPRQSGSLSEASQAVDFGPIWRWCCVVDKREAGSTPDSRTLRVRLLQCGCMILVAVDDFLFRSKIRATAKHAGVELVFAQTAADILEQARTLKPPLVIFDLNSAKSDPIGTITTFKSDPALSAIRTLGFVSHVDGATIAAARKAGIDQVMPRSAFAAQLGEILTAAGADRS